MIFRVGLILVALGLTVSAFWGSNTRSQLDIPMMVSDANVVVGGEPLQLPFLALNLMYSRQSFSLDRAGDRKRARDAFAKFREQAISRETAPSLNKLEVFLTTYGWEATNFRTKEVCPALTRQWAKAVCDNPWVGVRQALPQRFTLIDLSQLRTREIMRRIMRCPDHDLEQADSNFFIGKAVLFCRPRVLGSDVTKTRFFRAVVKVEGNLGAAWMVWDKAGSAETADAMAEREGRAIIAFVRYGLGPKEDYAKLKAHVCTLRKPGSEDHPNRKPDC